MDSKQLGVTSSACGSFTKNKRITKTKKQELRHLFTKTNQTKFAFSVRF